MIQRHNEVDFTKELVAAAQNPQFIQRVLHFIFRALQWLKTTVYHVKMQWSSVVHWLTHGLCSALAVPAENVVLTDGNVA